MNQAYEFANLSSLFISVLGDGFIHNIGDLYITLLNDTTFLRTLKCNHKIHKRRIESSSSYNMDNIIYILSLFI